MPASTSSSKSAEPARKTAPKADERGGAEADEPARRTDAPARSEMSQAERQHALRD